MKQVMTKSFRVGVVGTAKNTGKTTTLVTLLEMARSHDIPVAVTSIGYDGEAIDNLTFLPKPRLDVFPGIHIGTSEICVNQATASFELEENTEEHTSLGRVQILRASSPGRVLLAGPNNTSSLEKLLSKLTGYSPLVFVDGALGRMVPMAAVDAVIFATGASRTTNIRHLAEEMEATHRIFQPDDFPAPDFVPSMPDQVTLFHENSPEKPLSFSSILDQTQAASLADHMKDGLKAVAIPGAVAHEAFRRFLDTTELPLEGVLFYFTSPAMLLAGGRPILVRRNLDRLQERGARLSYRKPLPILAVTVNPFYPRQIGRRGLFEADYVDEKELYREFSETLDVPVFNIKKGGGEELFQLIQRAFTPEGEKS